MGTKRIKVLWVGDYNCPTGFAEVNKNILHRLVGGDDFEFHVLAVNRECPDPVYPIYFPIYECKTTYALGEIAEVFDKVKPDILFTLNDGHVMPLYQKILGARLDTCSWIGYITFDGTPIARWRDALNHMDAVIFPTEWQKQEINKIMPSLKCKVISYGVNTKIFKPVEKDIIKHYKKYMLGDQNEDAFIFGMVAKNFERKRYPELIQAFTIFKYKSGIKFTREPILVLCPTHARGQFNLENMAKIAGAKDNDIVIIQTNSAFGLPDEEMNLIYNMMDVNCLISIGEGYGLPTINAAACGKPTIAMDNSVQHELSKTFPMVLVPTDGQPPTWFGMDMEQIRFTPNCKVLAQALADTYYNCVMEQDADEYNKGIYDMAFNAAKALDWDNIAPQFADVIKECVGKNKKVQVVE